MSGCRRDDRSLRPVGRAWRSGSVRGGDGGTCGGAGRRHAVAVGQFDRGTGGGSPQRAGQEVHRRRADEAGHEQVVRPVVQVQRRTGLLDAAVAAFGGLDVLVNNAAIYATIERANFWEIDPNEWDKVMAVNVKGAWLASGAAYTRMNEGGSIINIASATVFSGSPLWMHYVASKGAVIGMTRVMAREAGGKNITVNAIAPGFTLTEASLSIMDDAASYGVSSRAIKRASEPDDMVGTATFLASDDASYITGQTIIVDGGKQFI